MAKEEGTLFKVHIMDDQAQTQDALAEPVIVEMGEYEVTAENGLFKNGKQYAKGDIIELVKETAERFIAVGEVKELNKK